MTPYGARTVVSCLGVNVEVADSLADQCGHLSRTRQPPDVSVLGDGVAGVAALTAAVVERTDLLALHACVVVGRDGLLVVPGASGLGKSTLALALLRQGFHHVSDEALALDRQTGRATPFPRPITVDAVTWRLLGLAGPAPGRREEALVDPGEYGVVDTDGGRVSDVLLAQRQEPVTHPVRAPAADGLRAMIPRCFNHHRDPANSLDTLVRLVTRSRVWKVRYTDARELAAVMAHLIDVP